MANFLSEIGHSLEIGLGEIRRLVGYTLLKYIDFAWIITITN